MSSNLDVNLVGLKHKCLHVICVFRFEGVLMGKGEKILGTFSLFLYKFNVWGDVTLNPNKPQKKKNLALISLLNIFIVFILTS